MAASADIIARAPLASNSDVAAHPDAAEVDVIARAQPPVADAFAYPSPRGPWPATAAAASGETVIPESATASTAAADPTAVGGAVSVSVPSAVAAIGASDPVGVPGAVSVAAAAASAAWSATSPVAVPGVAVALPSSAAAATASGAPTAVPGAVSVAVPAATASTAAASPIGVPGAVSVAAASATATTSVGSPSAVPGAVVVTPSPALDYAIASDPAASTTTPTPPAPEPTPAVVVVQQSSGGGGGGSIGVGWGGFDWLLKSRSSTGPTAKEGAALLSALRQAGNRMDAKMGADALLGHWQAVRGELKPEGRVRLGRGGRSAARAARRARGGTMHHAQQQQPTPSVFERAMSAQAPRSLAGFGYLAALPDAVPGVDGACVTPSTKTAGAFVRGESGAGVAFALATLGRAVLIAPGLYVAGVRGPLLVKASLGAAGAISLYILLYLRSTGCGR